YIAPEGSRGLDDREVHIFLVGSHPIGEDPHQDVAPLLPHRRRSWFHPTTLTGRAGSTSRPMDERASLTSAPVMPKSAQRPRVSRTDRCSRIERAPDDIVNGKP